MLCAAAVLMGHLSGGAGEGDAQAGKEDCPVLLKVNIAERQRRWRLVKKQLYCL